jgi:putative transposase
MPAPHPPEFRQRAVELAREREMPIKHMARDLGISESCLRNWVAQADVDEGKREGLTTSERVELRKLRSELRVVKMERDILKKAAAFLRHGERAAPPAVTFAFIDAERANYPIRLQCWTLGVSESGFHDWRRRPVSARGRADAELVGLIRQVHTMSRGTYGSPRVWAELRLGAGIRVSRKRVERLMRRHGLEGVYRRRKRGCTRRDRNATPAEDLVNRQFVAAGPDRLWVTDVTEHPTSEGQGVSRRGARRVVPTHRGLVDRRSSPR